MTSPDFVTACLEGFEPPTFWFVAKHSIRLSYRHTFLRTAIIIQRGAEFVKDFDCNIFGYLGLRAAGLRGGLSGSYFKNSGRA